jgi:hypothetical protein
MIGGQEMRSATSKRTGKSFHRGLDGCVVMLREMKQGARRVFIGQIERNGCGLKDEHKTFNVAPSTFFPYWSE